jgi:spore photoproduct lyase
MMEIRTKSSNIKPLLDLWFVPKNTEISFSLNPQLMIDKYEKWTSSLIARIISINKLLDLGFKVWIRFLPLLPVPNYEFIYQDFVDLLKDKINFCNINSTFASWLLYTKKDYNKILSKFPDLDILHMLDLDTDWFYRESKRVRENFYKMFKDLDSKCILCLEN